jgi:trk system potassium uptake protein TrkH
MKTNLLAAKKKIFKWFTVPRVLVFGFILIILIGTLLLMLPFSTKTEGSIDFLSALFTATSATCVTGLTVFNTFDTFTFFGQFVIMLLIQVGGLGFMTIASSINILVSKKITLRKKVSMQEDLQQPGFNNLKKLTIYIVLFALITESIGTIILTICFCGYYSFGTALWFGIFHSVSAYCNAGFDLIELGSGSMTPFYNNPVILLTIACLIIAGGLGFLVITDILAKKRWRRLSIHTKVVLTVTLILLLAGTAGIMIPEYNNPATIGNMSFGEKLLNSFFQSATTRTAGFNSFSMRGMTTVGLLVTMILMFIGASPCSTGGGLKTTTLFVLLTSTLAVVRRKKESVVDMREIDKLTIYKACATLFLALEVMALSMTVMLAVDGSRFDFVELLFEQISAYATVGLSTGITAELSIVSKLVIIFNMFLGRIGVLSFFISFAATHSIESKIKYMDANIRL